MRRSSNLFRFLGASACLFVLQLQAALTLDVSVQTSPTPQVTVSWNDQGANRVEVVRRPLGQMGIETWTVLSENAASPYVDTTVVSGESYEYSVRSITPTERSNRLAHFVATLEAPLDDQRGAVLLVVEETWADKLAEELNFLELTLTGDGWEVVRLPWTREGQQNGPALRAAIQQAVTDNPSINSLFIFGAVEVVKSGYLDPDIHGHHPHETDLYYADLDGEWTDASTYTNNIPGDGIYDQSTYPSMIELRTGRVTFHDMPSFKKTEVEYLRDYIHKLHAYRYRHRDVTYQHYTGDESFLYASNATLRAMVDSWRDGGTLDTLLGEENYLVAFGMREQADEKWLAARDGYQKAIFTTCFRSHYLQFWDGDNGMRGMLAQPDWGLTTLWGGRPAWYLHKLAAGLPIGQSVIDTQNDLLRPWNTIEMDPDTGEYSVGQGRDYEYYSDSMAVSYVSNNLMGDPTLRVSHIEPVPTLTLSRLDTSTVRLNWGTAPVNELIGYHVYSAADRSGPFTRLTTTPISATQFDAPAATGSDRWFQVRAVGMVTVPTGRYEDQSHGRFALAYADGSVNTPPVATDLSVNGKVNTPLYFQFPGSDADGDTLTPIVVENPLNGQIRWYEGQPYYVSQRDQPGTDTAIFVLFDGVTVSEPATVTFTTDEMGETLLAWELPNGTTSPVNPTFSASGVSSSAISGGPGTNIISAWPGTDSYTVRFIGSSLDENADYLQWTVTPDAGRRISLERINLGICGFGGADVFYELRASTDGFATHVGIPLERGEMKGRGYAGNAGALDSADTSALALLQGQDQPVDFRLHFWHTGGSNNALGIGKITDPVYYDAIEDVSFIGTVTDAQGAPLLRASPQSLELAESESGSIQISLSAPPASAVTVTVTRQSGPAELSVSAGESLVFDADNWSLPQTVTFQAAPDDNVTDDTAIFTASAPGLTPLQIDLQERDSSQPPSAQPDTYTRASGETLVVDAPGVLENDSHPNGIAFTAELVTDVQSGQLTLNPDGSFTYVPDAGFNGLDSFQYRAVDGLLNSAPVDVSIGTLTTELDLSVFGTVSSLPPITYAAEQMENGGTQILGGRELVLTGNGWFAVDLGSVTVDADTVLAFEFANPVEGEIHAIGFDTDLDLSPEWTFQFSGTQDWAAQNLDDYAPSAPGYKAYRLRVGDVYTGTFRYLFFAHDDDEHLLGQAQYRNLRIFQDTGVNRWAEAAGLDFLSTDFGMDADANGDGKPNRYAFAFAMDPMTDAASEPPLRPAGMKEGEDTHLTFTAPFRLGATFSGDPLTSAPIDGLIYRIYGDSDLATPGADLSVLEVVPALDAGLPPIGDFNQPDGEGWEYRTFRIATPPPGSTPVFMWVEISEAP